MCENVAPSSSSPLLPSGFLAFTRQVQSSRSLRWPTGQSKQDLCSRSMQTSRLRREAHRRNVRRYRNTGTLLISTPPQRNSGITVVSHFHTGTPDCTKQPSSAPPSISNFGLAPHSFLATNLGNAPDTPVCVDIRHIQHSPQHTAENYIPYVSDTSAPAGVSRSITSSQAAGMAGDWFSIF